MKNKYSKVIFALVVIVLFTVNMVFPSLKANAEKDPDFVHCYWQEYPGANYDFFCGYEVHDLHCTCGAFL